MENIVASSKCGIKPMLQTFFTDSFTDSRPMTRDQLLRAFSEEIIAAAVEAGFIYEHGRNQFDSPLYYISDSGRRLRDSED